MNVLHKLERKFDKYSVPGLYLIIIVCIIIGYIIRYVVPSLYDNMLLIPYMVVVRNQYWRLFTWIFTVPYEITSMVSVIFLPVNLFFYYYLGKSLEMYWGKFMYNLYVFGGMLLTNLLVLGGSFFYYYLSPAAETNRMKFMADMSVGADSVYAGLSITRYMLMSIFLAFTVVGGDNMVYLYFVIPLKMKWLAYVDLVFLIIYFVQGGLFSRLIIVGSIANYVLYAFINRKRTSPSLSDRRRQKNFVKAKQRGYRAKAKKARRNEDGTVEFPSGAKIITPGTGNPQGITIHKCAVCGRTEVDSPDLEFRFCSKCNGNYEYCSEHLYTHTHVN